ncbi:MAG: 16S rRNA (cytosine(1402)-N(4))-methyltransferase RsmH [Bradymonadales bacterium]
MQEVIDMLAPKEGEAALDLTLGGAGHARAIAKKLGVTGALYGLDRDPTALAVARQRLQTLAPSIHTALANFADLDSALSELGAKSANEGGGFDMVLADLGVSSHQLDNAKRGFSFQSDAPLDMRMGSEGESAAELLKRVKTEELADILFYYGDIRQSRRMAREISAQAQVGKLETTKELAQLCEKLLGGARPGQIHPATRVFQALRIAVNDELRSIEMMLKQLPRWCKAGARVAIISFHSGEDRIIKQQFRNWQEPCVCPKSLPLCACSLKSLGQVLSRKAVVASDDECAQNPRARSAKLRGFRFRDH